MTEPLPSPQCSIEDLHDAIMWRSPLSAGNFILRPSSRYYKYADAVVVEQIPGTVRAEIIGLTIAARRWDWLYWVDRRDKAFEALCNRWFLVAGPGVIQDIREVPADWGFLELEGDRLRQRRASQVRPNETLPLKHVRALVRGKQPKYARPSMEAS